MGLLSRLASLLHRPTPARKPSAHFDDEGVSCRWPGGEEEAVGWDDLREVCIQTTDAGPFVEDVFLVLSGVASRCSIPQEAIGFNEVLGRLQQLPGFDVKAVISSMSCTDNATFPCWRKVAS